MAMSGYELEQAYDEMLDDCYPVVKIGYAEFYASDILKNCDPVMYRIGLSEYEDEITEEEESDDDEE
jgi:hypothetical protein